MRKCKCCGSVELHILIDFGMQPVAHNLLDNKEQKDDFKHLLRLHYCENCGFVQINDPIPPEQLYTKYNYCFSGWKRQPQIQAEIELLDKYISNKNINILEIGCNDGVFLKPLYKAGYKNIVGIEANRYAAKEAMSENYDILNIMFDKNAAEKIKEQYHCFDLIVMRHVLEHIPDLDEFFEALNCLLDGENLIFIEVPDFGNALEFGDCSTIWEEHPNYFTYDVLEYMLNAKGYIIIGTSFYDFSGGSMCVLARKTGKPVINDVKREMFKYRNFSSVVNDYGLKLKLALEGVHKNGEKIFLYGTGARACTLVNGLGMGEYIDYAVDDQKEKQGHYMPGCHLSIISLEQANNIAQQGLFLLAVNHENEEIVSNKILSFYNAKEVKAISLFAPNDIFRELDKISEYCEELAKRLC